MPLVYLSDDELAALQDVFSYPPKERVDWPAFDRAKARVIAFVPTDTETTAPRMVYDASDVDGG